MRITNISMLVTGVVCTRYAYINIMLLGIDRILQV